ncbi:MAG TPA: MFS transporter, partial [Roseiflexaceae bacterium]|nr:MFS transporter [Roseiflexaceae bacterium]
VLMLIGVVRLLQVAGIASTSAFFNVYLDAELNIPTAQIGLVTAVGRLLAAPAALVTPLLTARMGERSAVFWSSLATALAMLPLALVPHLAAAGLTFVGVVGLSSVRYAASMGYFMALVPPRQRGAVAGVTEMAAGFSFTAMTFGGGYLIAVIGYRSLFLLGAALTGLGALVFALAFRAGTESRQQRGSRGASARSAPASGTTSVPRVRQGHREGELPVQAKERVLILCTANSARSQMAEGLLRALAGDRYEVFSAGARPSVVNPMAVAAMDERGIDIRGQHSKHLNEFIGQPFDYVITVCDTAAETCPAFPGRATRIHWSFSDPAAVEGEEARMAAFRQVRDAIEARLRQWLAEDR